MSAPICPICGYNGSCNCMGINEQQNERLMGKARWVRREIFKFKTSAQVGHLASCLSCVDILVSLAYDKTEFLWTRDGIVFSKGHGSPAIYPILADLGHIGQEELGLYCQPGGRLRLHSDETIPHCNFIGGSLGNGLGWAAGRAWADRGRHWYVVMGDAELYEGSVWEALTFIRHHNLSNLTVIVDRNGMGILGNTEELLKLEPLQEKFAAFGLDSAVTIDGHDFNDLRWALSLAPGNPQVIIANTVKGRGVSYMEGRYEYHSIIPKSNSDIEVGLKELSL